MLPLDPETAELIRTFIRNPATTGNADAPICYLALWEPGVISDATVDLVLSQSVLEYLLDLAGTYAEVARWLKTGGVMSYEIDFKSIGMTTEWNGHWACSDAVWRVAAGRRRHRINREPHSTQPLIKK